MQSDPLGDKTGLDTEIKNYRPVSNITYHFKIIDEAEGQQFAKIKIAVNRLLETLQSPYKKANSRETALIAVLTLSLLSSFSSRDAKFIRICRHSGSGDKGID